VANSNWSSASSSAESSDWIPQINLGRLKSDRLDVKVEHKVGQFLQLDLGRQFHRLVSPSPATEFRDGTDQPALGKSRRKASFVQLPELVRIQSEGFELSGPFRGRVAESLDTNAARQTTFDCCFDEVRCEERQRDSHIDLSHAAFLACGDLLTGVRAFEQALSSFRSALVHSRRLPFFLVTLAFFKFIVP
jgi:hypothetical protein